MRNRRWWFIPGFAVALAASLAAPGAATPWHEPAGDTPAEYVLVGPDSKADLNAIAATGAAINVIEDGKVYVSATASELRRIAALGFVATKTYVPTDRGDDDEGGGRDFPPADSGYHNYAELTAEVNALVAAHPNIAKKYSYGTSYEGRDLMVIKISDNVAVDENEPEALFDAHQHAREHLTVEMAIYLLHMLIDNYGTEQRVTNIVNSREIWIAPDVNPDGGEYDIASGSYRSWRKNRQLNAGSSYIGTDLNRNWAYRWNGSSGSSGNPGSDTYRGAAPFSAPETQKLADWVRSRVVDGKQQIRVGIDFHTYSELVLWPFGYTEETHPANMSADEYDTFKTIGQQMASTNGYTPEQSSELYVADGDILDWLWGDQRIFAYTFELYPGSFGGGGFYPPDEVIDRETARNKEAVLKLLEYAACPYQAIGKEGQYCG